MVLMGWDWIMGLLLLLGGALAGGLLVRIFGAGGDREQQLRQELDDTRKAFNDYRSEVEVHFRATADAVNAMTTSYRNVYDQLRAGADKLCGDGGRLLDLQPMPMLEQSEQAAPTPTNESAEAVPQTPDPTDTAASKSAQPEAPSEADEPAEAASEPEEEGEPEVASEPAAQGTDEVAAEGAGEEEPRAPLDYAVDGDDEEHEKTLH